MQNLIAKVAVEKVLYHFDKEYAYLIPPELQSKAVKGSRIMVPFGSGDNKKQGVIMNVVNAEKTDKRIKKIAAVLDEAPLLNNEMLDLLVRMKERTFCTLFDAAKTVLPSAVNFKTKLSFVSLIADEADLPADLSDDEKKLLLLLSQKGKYVEKSKLLSALQLSPDSDITERLYKKGLIAKNYDAIKTVGDAGILMVRIKDIDLDLAEIEKSKAYTKKQKDVLSLLLEAGSASIKEVCYFTGVTSAVINTLEKRGTVEFFSAEVLRSPYSGIESKPEKTEIILTEQQQKAFKNLLKQSEENKGSVSLLFGVTGSGKTQVFLKLIDEVIAGGKEVILMVPEISLTPQMLAIFRARYGDDVAVFHSGLSLGERHDEWKRVKSKKAKIVVGTRSAVFAPFENIGLIIMDEEQEHTYKSEQSPRYHAGDIAKIRCLSHKALLILASATPRVESFAKAEKGIYSLNSIDERYGGASLPSVLIVDMCKERAQGNRSLFSNTLLEELDINMQKGKQSILLMNRRGYNTFAACDACGKVISCPNCSISMTYHNANRRLMCHYCGSSEPFTSVCKECGRSEVRYSGSGTQRIEDELQKIFPEAKILRMDTDSTMSRFSHERKLEDFAAGRYNIMVGTQMVAKGLDFENVTLVAVLNADQQLYSDDYKSTERSFALITQVVGRSGRGIHEGKAIIQTLNPENETIRLAAKQDYKSYYDIEMNIRKAMIYPPYCDLFVAGFAGADETAVKAGAKNFFNELKRKNSEEYKDIKMLTLGPVSMRVAKVSNKYRYRIIIKTHNTSAMRKLMSELITDFGKNPLFKGVGIYVDINPESIF